MWPGRASLAAQEFPHHMAGRNSVCFWHGLLQDSINPALASAGTSSRWLRDEGEASTHTPTELPEQGIRALLPPTAWPHPGSAGESSTWRLQHFLSPCLSSSSWKGTLGFCLPAGLNGLETLSKSLCSLRNALFDDRTKLC